jgi:hypothetical protein
VEHANAESSNGVRSEVSFLFSIAQVHALSPSRVFPEKSISQNCGLAADIAEKGSEATIAKSRTPKRN